MGALRSACLTLAVFAAILYTTNSQHSNFGDYDDDYSGSNPWLQGGSNFRPPRQQSHRDGILFPTSFQQQGGHPESPVNLGQRPLNQQLPFQQQGSNQPQGPLFQQQNNNNFPNWPQQQRPGNGPVQQKPQLAGGNRPQGSGCSCASTEEYNPVCGSDNTTYTNPSHIRCSNQCGRPITILYHGTCRASSGSRG